MKFSVLALAAFLFAPFSLIAQNQHKAEACFRTAMSINIAGKGIRGQCVPYALDLFSRLNRLGAETYLIVYSWKDPFGHGKHCMVVYRAKDRYWGIDNMEYKPIWLMGNSPESWVKSFENTPTDTWIVSCNRSRSARPVALN